MSEKKIKLKFQGKKRSKRGICSMLFSLLSVGALAAASVMSGLAGGEGGIVVGYIGMGCFLAALLGFILGVLSFKEQNIRYFQPVFGSVVNGVMLVVMVSLYLMGILM